MKTAILLTLILTSVAVVRSQRPEVFHARLGNPISAEKKNGKVTAETYNFPPGFRVSVYYSPNQMAKSLRILPENSQLTDVQSDPVVPQEELQAALDRIVPLSDRGDYVMGTFLNIICLPKNDCGGVQWAYEKVSIYYNSGNGGMRYAHVTWTKTKKSSFLNPPRSGRNPHDHSSTRRCEAYQEQGRTFMTQAKNTICLWYDREAEDAARFYAETFPDSAVTAVHRAPGDFPSGKKGDVLTVEFTVMGIPCLGLNGGPAFKHNEAFSFQIATETQEETDRYWNAIVGNGGEESACGWCKDKWGLSWQITPIALTEAITDPDPAAAKRAFDAMMTMQNIDIAKIEEARRG